MSRLRRRAVTVAGLVTAVVLIPAAAFAASYTFAADFAHSLKSGSWSQGSGSDTYSFHCTAKVGEDYSVTLYKENTLADTNEGTKTFTCNSTDDTGTWKNLPGDSYHLQFTKAEDDVHIKGSGSISHPSN